MAQDQGHAVGLADLKVYQLSARSATPGGDTYEDGVDVPAINSFEFNPTYAEAQAEGDDRIYSSWSKIVGGTFTFEQATAMDLNVLEAMFGGTANDSGSTPNEATKYTLAVGSPYFFGAIGKAEDAERVGGDVHAQLFKARLNTGPEGPMAYASYQGRSWSGILLPGNYSDDPVVAWHLHETAVSIPTAWPGTTQW